MDEDSDADFRGGASTEKTAKSRLVLGTPPAGPLAAARRKEKSCGGTQPTTGMASDGSRRRTVQRPVPASPAEWALFLRYPWHMWGACCAKVPSPLRCNTLQEAGVVYFACGEGVQKIHCETPVSKVSTTKTDVVPRGSMSVVNVIHVSVMILAVMNSDYL